MSDISMKLLTTPLATLLVISGVIFLILAVVSQIGGYVSVHPRARLWSGIIGGCLLVVGLSLHIRQPAQQQPAEQQTAEQQTAEQVRIYAWPNYDRNHRWVSLEVGEYKDLGSWKNDIDSIKIPAGLKVTAWRYPNFRMGKYGPYVGPCDIPVVDGQNDWDSLKIEKTTEPRQCP